MHKSLGNYRGTSDTSSGQEHLENVVVGYVGTPEDTKVWGIVVVQWDTPEGTTVWGIVEVHRDA